MISKKIPKPVRISQSACKKSHCKQFLDETPIQLQKQLC